MYVGAAKRHYLPIYIYPDTTVTTLVNILPDLQCHSTCHKVGAPCRQLMFGGKSTLFLEPFIIDEGLSPVWTP